MDQTEPRSSLGTVYKYFVFCSKMIWTGPSIMALRENHILLTGLIRAA